jgi:hypothetical protein
MPSVWGNRASIWTWLGLLVSHPRAFSMGSIMTCLVLSSALIYSPFSRTVFLMDRMAVVMLSRPGILSACFLNLCFPQVPRTFFQSVPQSILRGCDYVCQVDYLRGNKRKTVIECIRSNAG